MIRVQATNGGKKKDVMLWPAVRYLARARNIQKKKSNGEKRCVGDLFVTYRRGSSYKHRSFAIIFCEITVLEWKDG